MGLKRIKKQINQNNRDHYISLIALHIVIALLIHFLPFFSKIYFVGLIIYFFFRILSANISKRPKEVLLACCYIIGAEVLLRMTSGTFFYESAKYLVILYVLTGIVSNGISSKAFSYFFYLVFLIPSIFVAYINLGFDSNFRTNVAFVLSGPFCLGLSALYLYKKKIMMGEVLKALKYLSLPIISMTVYLFLYNPSVKDVLRGTESNFEASGGFGPNQVATILGLGMFALVVRLFMKSPNLFLKILNALLLGLISYRGIITFSRGGIFAGIIIIAVFLYFLFKKSSNRQKSRIIYSFMLLGVLGVSVWIISSTQTEGLIDKRYANQDPLGREKEDLSTGRVDLFLDDLQGFIQNPFVGVGANGAKELRLQKGQGLKASHNEISRLLSEHGMFALFILVILIFTPLVFRLNNKKNIFFFSFLGFWFLTINHSAMRIAAPAFIYALALLNVQYEKRPIRRKRIIRQR